MFFSFQLPFTPQLRIVAIEEFWSVGVPLVTGHLRFKESQVGIIQIAYF